MARNAVRVRLTPGLATLLLTACAVAPPPVPPPPAADTAVASPLADAIIAESNRARAADGAGELRRHEALQRVAQSHADELAVRGVLDHGSPVPGRATLGERLQADGLSMREAGENLAMLDALTGRVASAPIRMWLTSEGHRHNLLHRSYTHTGVGIARDRRGNWYIVQLYMLPFGDAR